MRPLQDITPMQWAGGYLAASMLLGGIAVCGTAGTQTRPAASPPAPTTAPTSAMPEEALVNELDRLIQERFQVIDYQRFGVSRVIDFKKIGPAHPQAARWHTDSPAAREVSDTLARAGWDGVLLVGGQYVNRPEPERPAGSGRGLEEWYTYSVQQFQKRQLSVPVVLTGRAPAGTMPAREAVLPHVKEALAAEKPGETSFQAGNWRFVTRPIRAGKMECVGCHKDTGAKKVGDVLGVALYGFTPRQGAAVASR